MEELPLPGASEIHVWFRDLAISPEQKQSFAALLDPAERARAARFVFDRHRDAFLASHGWLRTLLGAYLRCYAADIEFTFAERGKPCIKDAPLRFNLSHSGAMAACAITRHQEVGIDIEQLRPDMDIHSWVRREAYVKATGEGLGVDATAPADWSVIDLEAAPGYAAAVAIRGEAWSTLVRRG